MIELTLPWPPKTLSPNSRPAHWAVLSSAKKHYRNDCFYHARKQGVRAMTAERLDVRLVFVPPDKRRRDADNCLAAMKSGLDGLADVLQVDDSKWKLTFELAQDETGGFVRVQIDEDAMPGSIHMAAGRIT